MHALGYVAVGVGGVALAAGITYFLLSQPPPEKKKSVILDKAESAVIGAAGAVDELAQLVTFGYYNPNDAALAYAVINPDNSSLDFWDRLQAARKAEEGGAVDDALEQTASSTATTIEIVLAIAGAVGIILAVGYVVVLLRK